MYITLSRKSWHARLAGLEYETLCEHVKVVAWQIFLRGILTAMVIGVAASLMDFVIYLAVWLKFRPTGEFVITPLGQLGATILLIWCLLGAIVLYQSEMFCNFRRNHSMKKGKLGEVIEKTLQAMDALIDRVCVSINWVD